MLDGRGYIQTGRETLGSIGEGPLGYTILLYGFEEFARAYVEDYGDTKEHVAFYVLNHASDVESGRLKSDVISEVLDVPELVVKHILKAFTQEGLIRTMETGEGRTWVMGVSAELRRRLGS